MCNVHAARSYGQWVRCGDMVRLVAQLLSLSLCSVLCYIPWIFWSVYCCGLELCANHWQSFCVVLVQMACVWGPHCGRPPESSDVSYGLLSNLLMHTLHLEGFTYTRFSTGKVQNVHLQTPKFAPDWYTRHIKVAECTEFHSTFYNLPKVWPPS